MFHLSFPFRLFREIYQSISIHRNSSYLNNVNSSYLNNVSKSNHPHYDRYMYDTKYSWNKHIDSCINNYILSGSNNYSDSYIYSYICGQLGVNTGVLVNKLARMVVI